jgi:hypothetical protein
MMAERFHASSNLLKRLTPGATFAAGEQITVPGVDVVPEPATTGHARSPGCVRPTNWDALKLAALLGNGRRGVR